MKHRLAKRAPTKRRLLHGVVGAACWLGLTSGAAAAYVSTVVLSGLNNPRGLAFGPDGALYIAEAGVASGTSPGIVVRGETLYGTSSGSVTRYAGGVGTRVVQGLSSQYNATNGDVVGPNAVVFTNGVARIVVGTGFDPGLRSGLGPAGAGLGRIVTPGVGSVDVSANEITNNPDHGLVDSNPWHAVAVPGALIVSDSGANALLRVSDAGVVSTIAAFPARALGGPFPTESVPTGVAVGADGAYYVGELTGFPFIPGSARVLRVQADGTTATFASGFTMITDLAFGPDGSLDVLEYDDDGLLNPLDVGSLWQIAADGTRRMLFDGLVRPTGFTIAADGSFYVSTYDARGLGEVVRITAIPEPASAALLLAGLLGVPLARRRAVRRAASTDDSTPAEGADRRGEAL